MADVSTITANGITYNIKDETARAELENKIYTVFLGTFSTFPQTISDQNITADMVVLSCVFSNPKAILSTVSWSTSTGQFQIDGSISGQTNAQVILGRTS